jgi:hypothetical protein
MKTGRLLKFQRPGADVQAYLYQDEGAFKAAVYVRGAGEPERREPLQELRAPSMAELETEVRAFVDLRFPRSGRTT